LVGRKEKEHFKSKSRQTTLEDQPKDPSYKKVQNPKNVSKHSHQQTKQKKGSTKGS